MVISSMYYKIGLLSRTEKFSRTGATCIAFEKGKSINVLDGFLENKNDYVMLESSCTRTK